jgi:hypothetical protein
VSKSKYAGTLPTGEQSYNVRKYVSAWQELAKPITKATGHRLRAFDPGLSFTDGRLVWDIPASVALKLVDALKEIKR